MTISHFTTGSGATAVGEAALQSYTIMPGALDGRLRFSRVGPDCGWQHCWAGTYTAANRLGQDVFSVLAPPIYLQRQVRSSNW